ncbi:MAG: type II secretion system protein [Nitrosomonadales bacterium]|nr:type II secretion system protein [Nitrosomonadales bacterium]
MATQGTGRATPASQHGISLIELIMFIVIVSVALAGILLVMNQTTRHSADPLIHKQALAIAESLLEEAELMPFTYCDPNDLNAASAVSATVGPGGCNSTVEAAGPEAAFAEQPAAETRYSTATTFDNVNDYHGFGMASGAIMDITNTNTGLAGFTLQPITVTAIDFGGITAASGDALLITVTVADPSGNQMTVEGIRTRYAPRTTP